MARAHRGFVHYDRMRRWWTNGTDWTVTEAFVRADRSRERAAEVARAVSMGVYALARLTVPGRCEAPPWGR